MRCRGCKIYTDEPPYGGIVDLAGGWTINQYGGSEGYLGWLALQPQKHRMTFAQLSPQELQALGGNIQRVETALRNYWRENFPRDGLEQLYIVHFFEKPTKGKRDFHLHIHLIPRTRRLPPLLREGSEIIAWRIYKVSKDSDFPAEYKTKTNKKNVRRLMQYLRNCLPKIRKNNPSV